MAKRSFKDKSMAKVYAMCRDTKPQGRGDGLSSAYRNGIEHPTLKNRYIRDSLAYAAWAAGVDDAKDAAK